MEEIVIKNGHDGKIIDNLSKEEVEKGLYNFIDWATIRGSFSSNKNIIFDGGTPSINKMPYPHLPTRNNEAVLLKSRGLSVALLYEALQHYGKSCMYLLAGLTSWSNNFMMPGEVLMYYSKFFNIIGLTQLQMKSIMHIDGKTFRLSCIDSNDGLFLMKRQDRGSPHKNWWYLFSKVFENSSETEYDYLWRDIRKDGFLDSDFRNTVNYSADIANDEIHYANDFLKDVLAVYRLSIFDEKFDWGEFGEIFPETFLIVKHIHYFTDRIHQAVPCPPMDYKKFFFRQFRDFLKNVPCKHDSIASFERFFKRNFFTKKTGSL